MGGGGTTSTTGIIPYELRGLYRGSADALLGQQGSNPLGQYNEANPMQVAGPDPLQNWGASLIAGGAGPSGLDALTLQSIMRGPGMAAAGPTTGSYDYGSEGSLSDFGDFLSPMFGTGGQFEGFNMRGTTPGQGAQESYGQTPGAPDYSSLQSLLGPFTGGPGAPPGPGGGPGAPPPSPGGGPGAPPSRRRPGGGGYPMGGDPNRPVAGHWDENNKWVSAGNDQAIYDYDARRAASVPGAGHRDPNGNIVINAAGAGHGAPVSVVGPDGRVSGYTGGGFVNGRLAGGGAPMSPAPEGGATPAPPGSSTTAPRPPRKPEDQSPGRTTTTRGRR